jgi:hypothetical protein
LWFIYRGESIEMLLHRQISHGMQTRSNHQKQRLDTQDADGGRKKSGVRDSSTLSGTQLETSNFLVGEHQISVGAYERSGFYSHMRRERESIQTLSDSADSREQVMHTPFLYILLVMLVFNSATILKSSACQNKSVVQATD